ncbi:alpha/beta fold hydrolase [Cucumibacter marinus]|uniref:alpha/beta fold hydrolase n=1 Tax=Cucumibacter marinus TaxID=1121252 RepID=UPI0004218324|nr:alpha/beta fold hydrolase [Cucumibacter marinus]
MIYKSEAARNAVEADYRRVLNDWPQPNRQRKLKTRFGETFIVDKGEMDAPAVLAFHGSGTNSSVYREASARWSRHFRVIAVDLLGQPGFSAPRRLSFRGDDHAAWIDDIRQELGLDKVLLAGVSLGGWVALDYAVRRPNAVQALALTCPGGIGRQKNFALTALPYLLAGEWGRRRIRSMVFGPEPASRPPRQQEVFDHLALIARSARLQVIRLPVLSDAQLGALPATLAIMGGRDVLVDSFETRRRLARHAPRATVKFIDEAYHAISGQDAEIERFLGSCSGLQFIDPPRAHESAMV